MTLPQTLCRRVIHWAAVAVFCVCICLPAADNLFHLAPQIDIMENIPAPLQDFSLSEIFRSFNVLQRGFLDKTYGFRKQLVCWQNILDLFVLHSSTLYQKVIMGQGRWLFLAQENAETNTVEDFRGSRLFTPEDLAWWVNVYRERQDRLAAQGIRYLVVLAPNKETIYPEFLPPQYNRISPINRTDQLVRALETAEVPILDLRPALFAAKQGALLYYRTDTHWTTFGAFIGYSEIMRRLAQMPWDFAPNIRGDYDIHITPGFTGDLSNMLALAGMDPENRVTAVPRTPRQAVEVENTLAPKALFQATVTTEINDPSLPTAIVFRDSFAFELIPFLSEHFKQTVYLWPLPSTSLANRTLDWATVDAVKPDLVIDEFVERYFATFPPTFHSATP